ncbi:hypothetical protein [Coleofasciculus sp. F4-SAH-05]|uniref:hypothetical protein n=1 Tax=Coleofasciculus sp. F4-SAH-05 TaxID=3069525 RepID=UPI0032F272F8
MNDFINFSTHTVRLASIELIEWDYREGAGDTQFIRIVVSWGDEILLDADGVDARILHEYGLKGGLKGFSESLTKREQFAAIALQGLLASGVHRLSPADLCTIEPSSESRFAEVAIWMADALIAKLEAK